MWVWAVSLPLTLLNASGPGNALQGSDYAGWSMWGLGFLMEVGGGGDIGGEVGGGATLASWAS